MGAPQSIARFFAILLPFLFFPRALSGRYSTVDPSNSLQLKQSLPTYLLFTFLSRLHRTQKRTKNYKKSPVNNPSVPRLLFRFCQLSIEELHFLFFFPSSQPHFWSFLFSFFFSIFSLTHVRLHNLIETKYNGLSTCHRGFSCQSRDGSSVIVLLAALLSSIFLQASIFISALSQK